MRSTRLFLTVLVLGNKSPMREFFRRAAFAFHSSSLNSDLDFGYSDVSKLESSFGVGTLFNVATLLPPTWRRRMYLQPLLSCIWYTKLEWNRHKLEYHIHERTAYLVSYLEHRALAFEHFRSVHLMWHIHFVAKTLDSSQGMWSATTFFGNVLKLYSTISLKKARTHMLKNAINKDVRLDMTSVPWF